MVKAYCDLVENNRDPAATLYKRVGVAKRHVERLKVFVFPLVEIWVLLYFLSGVKY